MNSSPVSQLTFHVLLDVLDIVLEDLRLEDHRLAPSVDHLGDGLSCIVHLKSVHQQSLGDFR